MKRNQFAMTALTVALALAQAPAWATNGYFLPGFGFRSMGMGGVGIAYGRDSLSIAANPANVTQTGMRGDLGVGVFNPERYAALGASSGVTNPNGTPAAASFGFDTASESDSKYFIMPEMGMTMPLTENLSVGVAVVGNGGMNSTYPVNFFSYSAFNQPPADQKVGVDMMQLLVPVTVGYKINEQHSVGAAVQFAETRFRAYGLGAFKLFDEAFGYSISSDTNHLTNVGYDYSYGAGVKLGWLGSFLDDRLTLGLAYTSRTYMTKFDKYRGLFAEQGDFDIPENYGVGVTFKPKKNLVISADVMRINYADIASVGNRGPGSSRTPYGNQANQLDGVISIPNASYELGNDQGMGFGWENQTVYKFGVQYGVNKKLQVRAGYNYGRSPIPNDQITFNTLAPAVVERHYSTGFTYRHSDQLEITGTYMYVASNSQCSPPRQNIVGSGCINMHQNLLALSMGWMLDPGPNTEEEYGESEWDGINFDGWYGGFNFGQSRYRGVDEDSANTRTEGWKVYGGYQFNKYVGIEGGYANLNDMTGRTGAIITNMDTDAWTLGAALSYPVTERLSLVGKLGAAYMLTDVDVNNGAAVAVRGGDDGFEPNYGVGISYALLDNLSVRAEWERFDRKEYDIDLMSAGIALKF